jgi:threonine dehydrogenase-like Zn-dependent dehydrogenase
MIACGAGTAYSVVSKLRLSGATTLAVFGLGPLGLAAAKVARGFGARVIGIDVNEERIAFARKLDLEAVPGGEDEELLPRLRELEPDGYYHILDTSGNRHARAQAVELAAANGTVAFVGMRDNLNTVFDIDNMIRKQLTLFGSYVYPITLWQEMKSFFVKQRISFDDMVTRRYRLEQAEQAFAEFQAGLAGKAYFVND